MNKPYLQFALLCDYFILDETTKKFSFIGIFDKINSDKLPVINEKLYVITKWVNISNDLSDSAVYTQNFKIIREEDENEIYNSKTYEKPFSFKNKKDTHTIVIGITNLGFDKPGYYYIDFYLDNDDQPQPQRIYFEVNISIS